jgi:hypothetical protein
LEIGPRLQVFGVTINGLRRMMDQDGSPCFEVISPPRSGEEEMAGPQVIDEVIHTITLGVAYRT